MCNLYSITSAQQGIRDAFRAMHDTTGNLPPQPAVFPDTPAPIIRGTATGRELTLARWGFPPPPGPLPETHRVTNIRNTASPFWRAWMGPAHRCLVPFNAFCEYAPGKPAVPHWFAGDPDRPLLCFAGLWRPWHGTRGTRTDPVEGEHQLFSFLTCAPNAIVGPIHPKAMPVILTTEAEHECWLTAPAAEALALQRPLPNGLLQLVARGQRQDPPREPAAPQPGLLL